jgi:hypothetical protein
VYEIAQAAVGYCTSLETALENDRKRASTIGMNESSAPEMIEQEIVK